MVKLCDTALNAQSSHIKVVLNSHEYLFFDGNRIYKMQYQNIASAKLNKLYKIEDLIAKQLSECLGSKEDKYDLLVELKSQYKFSEIKDAVLSDDCISLGDAQKQKEFSELCKSITCKSMSYDVAYIDLPMDKKKERNIFYMS